MGGDPSSARTTTVAVGTHYSHTPTNQLIGVSFNLGKSISIPSTDDRAKDYSKIRGATIYYYLNFWDFWVLNLSGTSIRSNSSNNRAYNDNNGNYALAKSNGVSDSVTGIFGLSRSFRISQRFTLNPSIAGSYSRTKNKAYQETNAGTNNLAYGKYYINEGTAIVSASGAYSIQASDAETYGIYPSISFTKFVRPGEYYSTVTDTSTGVVTPSWNKTAGKRLLSLAITAGYSNSKSGLDLQLSYTANYQLYKRSQELGLKLTSTF